MCVIAPSAPWPERQKIPKKIKRLKACLFGMPWHLLQILSYACHPTAGIFVAEVPCDWKKQ